MSFTKPIYLQFSLLCLLFSPFSSAIINTQVEHVMNPFQVIKQEIKKSPNDPRDYQVIRLSNELEVLLISDPALKNSAASISVPIGSQNNPDQQLGLAHYLEHMLFLGSERYPTINEYSKFMSQHGGYTNAYTAQDRTVYGFEVNDNALDEALDRLGDVMRAPLLDPKYADKERHTVNAENETYVDNDMRKLYALQRYTLNPKHPTARFSTGDLTTLVDKPGSKLQDELEQFFNTYYSANLMKVALTSPRSIADLQKIANKYLDQIPNKKIKKPVILTEMLTDKERAIKVEMKPTANLKLLRVNFLLPSVKAEYMYQPGGYISRLLGSDHRGGLSDHLHKTGLVESVTSSFSDDYSDQYSQFTIQFKLTNAGLKGQDTIMASLFAYINLIKEQGINHLQFEEQKKNLDTGFKYLVKSAGFNYVMGLSVRMQSYPYTDLLFGPYRLDAFNKAFIGQLLNYLTPENTRIFELTPNAKGGIKIPYYKGKYTRSVITKETQQTWLKQAHTIKMTLPLKNEWQPEQLDLVKRTDAQKAVQLIDRVGHSVWFQQSHYLDEPKAMLKLQLNSDLATQSAKSEMVMQLFLNMLNKKFSALRFISQEAGIGFSVGSDNGLMISTSGYSDKQPKLLLKVLNDIKDAKFSEQSVQLAKQELTRRIGNKAKIKPMDLALDGFRQVIRQPSWSDKKLSNEIEKINLNDIESFVPKLFTQSSLRLLALGNLSRKQVLTLDDQLAGIISIQSQPFYNMARFHADANKGGINYSLNSDLDDDALAVVYVTSLKGNKALATAELLNKLLSPAFYNQIRTQEQLTYSPFSASFAVDNYVAFGLFTQSPVVNNAQLYTRFSAFIEAFYPLLEAITPEKFAEIKKAHIANYLAAPTTLSREFSYLKAEWSAMKPQINNKQKYIDALKNVSIEDVRDFYQKVLAHKQSGQEILVQVQGEKFKGKPLLRVEGEQAITNIDLLVK